MNEPKSYAMRMARADEKDIEIVQSFWDKLQDAAEAGHSIEAGWLAQELGTVEGSFNRVFWGYQTLHDNACDKTLDYLDYKPEIKAIDGLLAALESFVRYHHNETDTTVVTLCDEARAAIAAAKEQN